MIISFVQCGIYIWNLSKLLENPFGILKNEQRNEFNNLLCIFQDLPKTFFLHQGKVRLIDYVLENSTEVTSRHSTANGLKNK